jgi:hypothetical protein
MTLFGLPLNEKERNKQRLKFLLNYGGGTNEIKKLQKIIEESEGENG